MPALGTWNAEKLWHMQPTNTASYLLPPLAHIANGPSGLTYHPGASLLPERYARHFFLCDFRGSGGGSGIHTFMLKPRGASFELVGREKFAWSVLATDCDFAPDGGFYLSDWVDGWGIPNKGRLFKLFDPSRLQDPTVKEVKELLAQGFEQRSMAELTRLLDHKDQRIRQEAQFTLADRKAVDALAGVVRNRKGKQLARLHAIWGLGQIGRKDVLAHAAVIDVLGDADEEVRAQAIKVLGDAKLKAVAHAVEAELAASNPRVRFMAAMAVGKIGDRRAIPALIAMIRANKDEDPYLRHAGVMALVNFGDHEAMRKAATDASSSARMAALQAMRRLRMPEVADLLNDADKNIVLEAARAIYDVPIGAAMPKLAQRARTSLKDVPERAVLRVLAANYRLGGKENAQALVAAATRSELPVALREQALKMLQAWEKPSGRDWVVGLWRPLPTRSAEDVAEALRPALAALMTGPDQVRTEAAKLAARHGMKEIGPALRALVVDSTQAAGVRIEALQALETLKDAQLELTAKAALADSDPRLRHQGRRILLQTASKEEAVQALAKVLHDGATVERQGALALLAAIDSPASDKLLEHWLGQLVQKKAPPEIHLDILLAVEGNKRFARNQLLAAYQITHDSKNPSSNYREALVGGDAETGRKIFFEKSEVSCLRCHKINGVGGEVGPDLTGIGKKYPRDYLLESIVEPNKQIAKGYETLVVALTNGQIKTGILKSEDAKEVRLMTAEGQLIHIPRAEIDERSRGPSAMPADLVQKLSRREVRDLVEFLAGLK
jgi:quinoprotein glucose dehydrogenase